MFSLVYDIFNTLYTVCLSFFGPIYIESSEYRLHFAKCLKMRILQFLTLYLWNLYSIKSCSCTCMFDKYHGQKLSVSTSATVIDRVKVSGSVQCQLRCQEDKYRCTAVNLVFSKKDASFICEMLENIGDAYTLISDKDYTFMELKGWCF